MARGMAAAALVAPGKLTPVEGREVLRATIKLTKAGDGLSAALSIDPAEYHFDERVFLVIETKVADLQFPEIKDTQARERKHVLSTVNATIVDESLVREVLDAQAEKLQAARDAAAGVSRLPFGGDVSPEAEAFAVEHEDGQHKNEARAGCPLCDESE